MTRRRLPAARLPRGLGLRQRLRDDGTLRLWWEPNAAERAAGARPCDLDPDRLSWSIARARALRAEAGAAAPGTRADGPRTISDLIAEYRASPRWRDGLRPATRTDYAAAFARIAARWGSRAVTDITKPMMTDWYETLYRDSGPHQALAMLRKMSLLLSYAESRGWRPEGSNPCQRLAVQQPRPRQTLATWAQHDALMQAADRLGRGSIRMAICLSLFNGQRLTDILAARRGDFACIPLPDPASGAVAPTWVWRLTRSKRGTASILELHPLTVAALGARLASQPEDDRLLIDEATHTPYTYARFQDRWAETRALAARESGLEDLAALQFRDLRRTFGTWARWGGADAADAADALGNNAARAPRLAETYLLPGHATTSRAIRAIRRPEEP